MNSLKFFRELRGYTSKEVARALKMTEQGYWSLETGKNRITDDKLIILSDMLDVSIDELLRGPAGVPADVNRLLWCDQEFMQQYFKLNKKDRMALQRIIYRLAGK